MNTDAELLCRYAETASEPAFTEFVSRHIGLVYHAALRQLGGDTHRAKDVTQLVFTDLARKAGPVARHPAIVSWLHKSTRYAATKALRAEECRQRYEEEAEIMREHWNDDTSLAEWERLRPLIDGALHELTETDREAVLLRFFEGRSFAQVGAALGVTEDSARMRVTRALEKLQARLMKRGITSPSAALGLVLSSQAAAAAPVELLASVTGAALSGSAMVGATSGFAATFLTFMTATKGMIAVGVFATLALATAVFQSSRARFTAAALADAEKDYAALRSGWSDLERRTQAADKAVADRKSTVDRTVALPAPSAPASPPARQVEIDKIRKADPQLRTTTIERARANARMIYQPLFQRLAFTSGQIEQTLDLVAAWANRAWDRAGAGVAGNFSVDHEGARNIFVQDFRTRFGDAAAEQLVQFLRTLPIADLVNGFSARLYYTDAPLTAQQAERLTQIISEASTDKDWDRKLALAGTGLLFGYVGSSGGDTFANTVNVEYPESEGMPAMVRRTRDWDRILAESATVLSPVQWRGLHALAAIGRVDAQPVRQRQRRRFEAMKTKALILLIVGMVVAIAFAIRATFEIQRNDAAIASLAMKRTEMRADETRLSDRLHAAEAALAAKPDTKVATTSADPRRVGPPVTAPAAEPGSFAHRNWARMVVANDPKAMEAYLTSFRESLDLLYGGMFKALGMSQEQIERFKQMKVAVEQRRLDFHAAVEAQGGVGPYRPGGLKISSEGYLALRKEEDRARMQAEAELFGPLEQSYRTYYRTNYVRETVARLASTEAYPDLRLNSGQVEKVTQVIDGHSLRKPSEFFSWNHWPTINWTAAAPQLQTIISPTQLANLRAVVQREEVNAHVVQRRIDLDAEFRNQQRRKGR
ncbi:MAG: sigma-70 family RNA polymerase sigma factor [Opitutaceae bacterium]|nr:sigma-70 family RNA polymerase sigma factor [Opitutaceae bacterium]